MRFNSGFLVYIVWKYSRRNTTNKHFSFQLTKVFSVYYCVHRLFPIKCKQRRYSHNIKLRKFFILIFSTIFFNYLFIFAPSKIRNRIKRRIFSIFYIFSKFREIFSKKIYSCFCTKLFTKQLSRKFF